MKKAQNPNKEKIKLLKRRLNAVIKNTAIDEDMTCGEVMTAILQIIDEEEKGLK